MYFFFFFEKHLISKLQVCKRRCPHNVSFDAVQIRVPKIHAKHICHNEILITKKKKNAVQLTAKYPFRRHATSGFQMRQNS